MQAKHEPLRILVVPGDLLLEDVGESFLDRDSLSTRTAATGTQALAVARTWLPQLVILRSSLDEMPVSLICKSLKEGPAKPKILMLTDHVGHSPDDIADAACDAHLVSPVEPSQLLDTVANLLGVEQRRAPRVPLHVLVHAEGFLGEGTVDVTLANSVELSEEGMLIESNCHLVVNSTGRLQFFLPGGNERIAIAGVVHLAVDEVRLLYAIEFVDLAPQYRAAIRRYLDRRGNRV